MMIETLALTVVASLADWPTYTDTQWIHTEDWSARIKVNYYEETNLFEYWAIKDIQKDEEILTDYSMTLAIKKHGSLQAALENYSGWHNRTQLLINGRHHTKPIISNPTKINKYGRPIRPFRKKS